MFAVFFGWRILIRVVGMEVRVCRRDWKASHGPYEGIWAHQGTQGSSSQI